MPCGDHRLCAGVLLGGFFMAISVCIIWPQLDIWMSGLFYDPANGFWLARISLLDDLRYLIWDLSTAMVLFSIVGIGLGIARRPIPGFGLRETMFVFLLYLLGPILLVNGVLKNHWGRARPADVTEFGGSQMFTPPYLPTDQCLSNCSFVSGEASAAVALALAFFLLLPAVRRVLPGWLVRIYTVLALVLPTIGIVLRIATGRHFLSDIVFAILFTLAIALGLSRSVLRQPAR